MNTRSIGSDRMIGSVITTQARFLKILLICGILSSLYHIGMDVIGGTRWQNYSWLAQEFSQLSAIDTPSRPLHLVLAVFYAALVVAFGLGVWWAAGGRRALRVVGALLVVFAVTSWVWPQFFPLKLSGPDSEFIKHHACHSGGRYGSIHWTANRLRVNRVRNGIPPLLNRDAPDRPRVWHGRLPASCCAIRRSACAMDRPYRAHQHLWLHALGCGTGHPRYTSSAGRLAVRR
jgi:hypothetical protein